MAFKRTRKEFEADLQSQQSPFVFYGTPLPPLDPEVRDDGSYVPVWQQEVRDERGRKRLHGAFTGGFSAGYFNTVGSKEGWTPSTFVSSRSNRAKDGKTKQEQRPTDFMDEEDMVEASEKQALETNESFAGLGTTDQDARHRTTVMDLFRPQDETMGYKLLRKMGWRDGQGIGPKIRRILVKHEDERSAEFHQRALAPINSPMIQFSRKSDRQGLGHQGEGRLGNPRDVEGDASNSGEEGEGSDHVIKPHVKYKTCKQTAKPRPAAFGVGVLNDNWSDDEDPYSMGPKISYNRTIGMDKKPKHGSVVQPSVVKAASKPLLKSRDALRSTRPSASARLRKCHDGRPLLDRFVLAQPLVSPTLGEDDKYAPPAVPGDWQPTPKVTNDDASSTDRQATADAAKGSKLDAKGRAAILGEDQLPGKSVFDFISPGARDRLATSTKNQSLPPGRGQKVSANVKPQTETTEPGLPPLNERTAQEALQRGAVSGLRNTSEARKGRFETFLEYRAGHRDQAPLRDQHMSKAQWVTELDEFVSVSKAFKPMSGLIASRFTSAGVSKPSDDNLKQALSHSQAKPKDPAEEAASMDMFGPMTRSQHQFHPTRLACKRFNVRPPTHVDEQGSNQPVMTSSIGQSIKELSSSDTLKRIESKPSVPPSQAQAQSTNTTRLSEVGPAGDARPQFDNELMERADVYTSHNDALENERASEEVFRAIFGGDESDSS